MKCLFFVQYFPPEKSSGSDLVEDLLEGFSSKGWQVDLFTPTPTRGVSDEVRREYSKRRIERRFNDRLTIHRMHLYKEGKSVLKRAFRYCIFSFECLIKALTVPADFIFTGSGPPTQGVAIGLARKILPKKKFIYNLQDVFPDSLVTSGICNSNSFIMRIGYKMEKFTYNCADIIITISDDMRLNIINKGVNPDKVVVIRNWIDTSRIHPVIKEENHLYNELHLDPNAFYVVYAGNLGKVQGVDVIVESARLLESRNDIKFLIFGNGSEEERIKSSIQNTNNIIYFPLQPVSKVSEVYSLGAISIIPCKAGTGGSGMPSKTWSIMATGTAIIASFDLGGEMERTINESGCGLCVKAGDAKALADAIVMLKEKPDLLNIMSTNSRKYAENEVNKEQAVKKYIESISKAV